MVLDGYTAPITSGRFLNLVEKVLLNHQQPDVNCIQVLEKVDFACSVHAQRVPFKGNQLRAETG